MINRRHHLFFVVAVPLAVALACSLPGETPTSQPETEATATDTPAGEPATATQAPIQPPTETPVPSETPTITPTPGPNFGAASVYAVSHLSGSRLLVTIQVPGGVEGTYQATVGPSTLNCEILSEYPDRLYCNGPEPFQNYTSQKATVTLYSTTSGNTVFQAEFDIPPRPTPTPTPTNTPTPGPTPTL